MAKLLNLEVSLIKGIYEKLTMIILKSKRVILYPQDQEQGKEGCVLLSTVFNTVLEFLDN